MVLSLMEVIMPEDNLAQFKKILANLPEDRRKRLYERLHAMPASQREAFISDFTRKYLSGQRKHPSKKTGTQVKANVSGKKPSSPNGSAQKKAQPANAQKKAQPANGQKKPASANNQPQKKQPSPAGKNNAPSKQAANVKKQPVQLRKKHMEV